MATKALFWTGNRSLEEAADWSTNRGLDSDTERELSLEVEVAMWREDLRMREEVARTEQVLRSVQVSLFMKCSHSGTDWFLFRPRPSKESWKPSSQSSVLESLRQPLPRLPTLPHSHPPSSLPSICPAPQERHSFSHRCQEAS